MRIRAMAVPALEAMLRSFVRDHPDRAEWALEDLDSRTAAQRREPLPTRIAAPLPERPSPGSAAPILTRIGADSSRDPLGSLPSARSRSGAA
jgi:hypothetical protein